MAHKILEHLGAQNRLFRQTGMNIVIPRFLIIAGNQINALRDAAYAIQPLVQLVDFLVVNLVHKRLNILNGAQIHLCRPLEMRVHRIGDRAGVIQLAHAGDERLQRVDHTGMRLVFHLVAHAPQEHAGTIAVPQNHCVQVMLPVLIEIAPVQAAVPFIERFFIDVEAHFVAQVEKLFGKHMMRQPQRVAADFLELPQAGPPQLRFDGYAPAGEILMQAHAF